MVRRVYAFFLAVALLFAGSPEAASAQGGAQKLGYLNARAVLLATPGFAQAESTYNRELLGFRGEVEKLQSSLDSAAADFEQKSVMLSATAKTARRRDLEEQRGRLEARAKELQDKAAQREQDLLSPIHNLVNAAIEAVRADGNYAILFDVSANDGLIVAADKSVDVTVKVLEKLKARP